MLKRLLQALLLCLPFSALAADYPVGNAERFHVPGHERYWRGAAEPGLRIMVWYPAASGSPVRRIDYPPFEGIGIAENATPIPGRRPLVVMSHGTGGSAASLAWIAGALAAQGYIVAAPNHPGNNALAPLTGDGFLLWWERAADLGDVIDFMLADPVFAPVIDRERIGALGYSLGGYSVLALAGARTDRDGFLAFCRSADADATCTPPEMDGRLSQPSAGSAASLARSAGSFRDPRVRAVFAIAPALGKAFSKEGMIEVTVPVEIVAGDADVAVPPATNAQRIAGLLPSAHLRMLPGAGHPTFLDLCLPDAAAPDLCRDGAGVDRAEIHRATVDLARAFFAGILGPP